MQINRRRFGIEPQRIEAVAEIGRRDLHRGAELAKPRRVQIVIAREIAATTQQQPLATGVQKIDRAEIAADTGQPVLAPFELVEQPDSLTTSSNGADDFVLRVGSYSARSIFWIPAASRPLLGGGAAHPDVSDY